MNSNGQAILDDYLAQVTAQLRAAGHDPQEEEVVLDALHEQLDEARAHNPHPPTIPEARAILAQMAPPESYGPSPHTEPTLQPDPQPPNAAPTPQISAQLDWLGKLSAALCIGTIILCVLIGVLASTTGANTEELGGATLIMGLSAATICGFIARKTPAGRFGLFGGGGIMALCLILNAL